MTLPGGGTGSGLGWASSKPCALTVCPHRVLGLVLQVTMPGEPVDVACGVDHMVTLAKSFV